MRHLKICIALLSTTFLLSACKKEDPNPELRDPIYSDLQKRQEDEEKALETEKKTLEDSRASLEKAEPNSVDVKNFQKAIIKSQHLITEHQQRGLYYKIRAERRLHVDRITYSDAFKQDKAWPDPREYSDYLENIHLREVPMNWDQRVPKLQDRIVNASKAAAKSEKPAEKKED